MDFNTLLRPEISVFVVAVVAIVVCGVVQITKTVLRHRERIVMIQNGMHPDAHAEENPEGAAGFEGGEQRV